MYVLLCLYWLLFFWDNSHNGLGCAAEKKSNLQTLGCLQGQSSPWVRGRGLTSTLSSFRVLVALKFRCSRILLASMFGAEKMADLGLDVWAVTLVTSTHGSWPHLTMWGVRMQTTCEPRGEGTGTGNSGNVTAPGNAGGRGIRPGKWYLSSPRSSGHLWMVEALQ